MDSNKSFIDSVDAKTKLAGSNKLEILLFSLGTDEIFGINVFKVREVLSTPKITPTPNMPYGIEGIISLRGEITPVISLAKLINLPNVPSETGETMIVTEFSRRTQSFLVHDVDRIIRVEWKNVKQPKSIMSFNGEEAMVTAITEIPEKYIDENGKEQERTRLVSILDVERILFNAIGEEPISEDIAPLAEPLNNAFVFFADDSHFARKEIISVLDRLGVSYQQASNGAEAWEKLQGIAARSAAEGAPLKNTLKMIMTDIEMPEMDGYVLAKNIKSDARFEGIPVVMHSSLSSVANRTMGENVGIDEYVAKFDPTVLAETVRRMILK